mmetsp:Transcript_3878/g.11278  ORF Transcript_3878/g.11278 Transcript_3878/m.11278 type:complete len:389 (-) Transcript_3878:414-1580(-)
MGDWPATRPCTRAGSRGASEPQPHLGAGRALHLRGRGAEQAIPLSRRPSRASRPPGTDPHMASHGVQLHPLGIYREALGADAGSLVRCGVARRMGAQGLVAHGLHALVVREPERAPQRGAGRSEGSLCAEPIAAASGSSDRGGPRCRCWRGGGADVHVLGRVRRAPLCRRQGLREGKAVHLPRLAQSLPAGPHEVHSARRRARAPLARSSRGARSDSHGDHGHGVRGARSHRRAGLERQEATGVAHHGVRFVHQAVSCVGHLGGAGDDCAHAAYQAGGLGTTRQGAQDQQMGSAKPRLRVPVGLSDRLAGQGRLRHRRRGLVQLCDGSCSERRRAPACGRGARAQDRPGFRRGPRARRQSAVRGCPAAKSQQVLRRLPVGADHDEPGA